MAEVSKELDGFFDESVEKVNMTDLTQKVESVILSILQVAHTNPAKHQFRKRARSIQFPCPICGDSKDDPTKMRGHIYLEYGIYKCYNNNSCSSSLQDFLRQFDVADIFTPEEFSELQKVAISNRAFVFSARQSVSLLDADAISPFLFDREQIKQAFGAIEIKDDSFAAKKVSERCIPMNKWDNLLWVPKWQRTKKDAQGKETVEYHSFEIIILNQHNESGKILNFQRRQTKANFHGPKYMTTTYSDICEVLNFEVEEEVKKKMEIVGQFFNVLNVDWANNIYVFEGAMDSFFMPNSLALTTAGVELQHSTFHYVYDDDITGRKEAFKMLDKRFPVFMWKKFLIENPIYKKQFVKKRDFNDLYKIKPFDSAYMATYFTSNPLQKLNV